VPPVRGVWGRHREGTALNPAFPSREVLSSPHGPFSTQIWDPEEGRLLHELRGGDMAVATHVFESAGGRHCLVAGDGASGTVMVWDLGEAPS
jgi:hypothetical protein